MPNNNKKVKKGRGTVLSLNSFLGDTPSGTVVKKISTADTDEGDDENPSEQIVLQLPTAPKASRLFDDDAIPHSPPFIARLSNLPFDGDEEDIREFFGSIPIVSLKLPREDGETGRVRGFGNVEFETREDFIRALSMPDPILKGRRIRIEQFNENEQQHNAQRMNKRGHSSFAESGADRESTNWRQDSAASGTSYGGSTRSHGYDSGNRDNSGWRQNHSANRDDVSTSSWRSDNRPSSGDFSSWRNRSDDDRRRNNFSSNRNFERSNMASNDDRHNNVRTDDTASSWRNRSDRGVRMGYNSTKKEGDDYRNDERPIEERPRLDLKPRTLPMPEIIVKEDNAFRSTTPEETEIAAMPSGSARLDPRREAGGMRSEGIAIEPEIARADLAERPHENARMANIGLEDDVVEAHVGMEDGFDEHAGARAPERPLAVDDAPRFAAVLQIVDDHEDLHNVAENQPGPSRHAQRDTPHQNSHNNATHEARNRRNCNQFNISLEGDSGHDSDGAVGYNNRD